jgi:hypothetical protein
MIIVKATRDSESGMLPTEAKMAEMARYHEELQEAGVLVDASGLQATSNGWRIRYEGAERIVTDGPFVETKELIAGYTVIRTQTREEALAWTRRFPNPDLNDAPCEIEVRRMFDLEDFEPTAAVEQFRRIGVGGE